MKRAKPSRDPRSGRGLKDGLNDGARSARPERSRGAPRERSRGAPRELETLYVPFGPAGEVLREEGFEQLDATRDGCGMSRRGGLAEPSFPTIRMPALSLPKGRGGADWRGAPRVRQMPRRGALA